jgi:hypothetical protein
VPSEGADPSSDRDAAYANLLEILADAKHRASAQRDGRAVWSLAVAIGSALARWQMELDNSRQAT